MDVLGRFLGEETEKKNLPREVTQTFLLFEQFFITFNNRFIGHQNAHLIMLIYEKGKANLHILVGQQICSGHDLFISAKKVK